MTKKLLNTKGVSKRKNGKIEAYVVVKQAGKRSKASFKAHVGTFNTVQEAEKARINYIINLA